MNSVTVQEVAVLVSVIGLIFLALTMFRSTMKDLKVELRRDINGLSVAMNGLREALEHVAESAASKLELERIDERVLEHDRKIIRVEARLQTVKDQIERMVSDG